MLQFLIEFFFILLRKKKSMRNYGIYVTSNPIKHLIKHRSVCFVSIDIFHCEIHLLISVTTCTALMGGVNRFRSSARYAGARPYRALNIKSRTLQSTQNIIDSQCSLSKALIFLLPCQTITSSSSRHTRRDAATAQKEKRKKPRNESRNAHCLPQTLEQIRARYEKLAERLPAVAC